MSRRCSAKAPRLELKLQLSSPTQQNGTYNMVVDVNGSPHRSSTSSSSSSPPSSCVSTEGYPSSPETRSMVLVGCPQCLMYVMLSEDDPKCPRCKSTVLLDLLNDPNYATINSSGKNRKQR